MPNASIQEGRACADRGHRSAKFCTGIWHCASARASTRFCFAIFRTVCIVRPKACVDWMSPWFYTAWSQPICRLRSIFRIDIAEFFC